MKIGVRLILGFAVVFIAMITIIIFAITELGHINNEVDLLVHDRVPKVKYANNIIDNVNLQARELRNIIITSDMDKIIDAIKLIDEASEEIQKNADLLHETIKSEKGKQLLEEFEKDRKVFVDIRNEAINIARENTEEAQIEVSKILFDELRPAQINHMNDINDIITYQEELQEASAESAEEQYKSATMMMYIIGGIAIVLGIIIALWLIRSITSPISKAVDAAKAIAKGNMNVDLETDKKDETAILLNAMKAMVGNIKGLIEELNKTADAAVDGKLDNRANEDAFEGEYKTIMKGFNSTLDAVIGPLNVTAEYVDRISKGDIPPKITDSYRGDFNEIKNNLNGVIDVMNGLLKETNNLINATKMGQLDTRADSDKFAGDWGALVSGVNQLVDAMVAPLNVTAEYVDRISKGDIPPKITDIYHGDFNEIKNNLNSTIDVMNSLLSETNSLIKATKMGQLDTRADSDKFAGDWGELVNGVNQLVDAMVAPLNVTAEYIDRISKGDIPPKITDVYHGDFNEIKNNLNGTIDVMNSLLSETNALIKAAKMGQLDTRADSDKFIGDWGELVSGVNQLVDAMVAPLNVTAEYIDRVSKGDMPPKITDVYHGDFNEIKNNLNQLIDNLSMFINDMNHMSSEHDKGDIDVVIETGKFTGFYSNMASGVNEMVNGHINVKKMAMGVFKEYGKGNFDANIDRLPGKKIFINETIDMVQDNLKLISEEIKMLIKKSIDGQLQYRGDTTKYEGDWKEMVAGINEMIDALLDPVNEAGSVLEVMATGDLRVRMQGHYKGENENLKKNINLLGESLSDLINQVNDNVLTSSSSAAEISATSDSLAASTQEQSAQADEVASAVEEMSRTITDNAMSANKTSEVAKDNGEIAREGAGVVEQTIKKMNDIAKVVKESAGNIEKLGDSSKQIGEIISVIDDIADQTNLLALNAAIEAARAGEQGRGFAVVADEVRKLAERTTEATKQIASMIKGIQSETESAVLAMNQGTNEVNSGIELADQAGTSLNKILESTQEVIDMINQIAAASEEQSATSEQISKNVVSISKVTSESAKRVEDVSKTAEELAQITEQLSNIMQRFKVDNDIIHSKSTMQMSSGRVDSRHLPAPEDN